MEIKVLSIAGFDPCGGAGILADTKVFESLKTSSFGVCTCLTYQNDQTITGIKWFSKTEILSQIQVLLQKYTLNSVKISLVPNMEILKDIIMLLKEYSKKIIIIWDPVLRSSSGFPFYSVEEYVKFKELLPLIDVVTPNIFEFQTWFPLCEDNLFKGFKNTYWVIKSYQKDIQFVYDLLYINQKKRKMQQPRLSHVEKHGSGCMFASVLTVYVGQGFSFVEAYQRSYQHLSKFLRSTHKPLGKVC